MRSLSAKKYAHLQELEAHEIGRPHFRMHNPLITGLGDYRVEPLWDIYLVAASTPCVKEILFSVPQNNPYTIPGGANFIKTVQSTSMQKSAELPSPERFLGRSIAVYLANNMNQDDVSQFCSQTYLSLFLGSSGKSFFQVPLVGKLPAGGGAWAQQANSGTGTGTGAIFGVTGNGLPTEAGGGYPQTAAGVVGSNTDGSDSFPQIDGILFPQNQTFGVIVDPTLAAHVSAAGFTTAATDAYAPGVGVIAWVLLEGTHVVAVQ